MFPNKITSIQDSVFSTIVDIMKNISNGKDAIGDLFKILNKKYETDMILISFDILYLMNYIDIGAEGHLHVIQN